MAALGLAAVVCLALAFVLRQWLYKTSSLRLPPFVDLKQHETLKAQVQSITTALREHGPIIRMKRNGKTQYLVAKEYTRRVLTDEKSFSSERGNAQLLGLKWVYKLHSGTFFRDMDSITRDFLTRRMEEIAPQVWPIFERGVSKLAAETEAGEPVHILRHVQLTMAEATMNIFFGEEYNSAEFALRAVEVAESIAELMGLFQNQSYLARKIPWLWRLYTQVSVVLFKIPFHLGRALGGKIWADLSRDIQSPKEHETIVSYLAQRYASGDGQLATTSKLWIFVLVLTILFASLHQTAKIVVWVTYYLALQPESQDSIRDESWSLADSRVTVPRTPFPSHRAMQQTPIVDSFVREVLRMKGDIVNVVRESIRDVELGGYIIPKGSIVLPITYLSNRSPEYISQPDDFDALRWINSGKYAATTGPGYLPFGIGRWSCPGRTLAVLGMYTALGYSPRSSSSCIDK